MEWNGDEILEELHNRLADNIEECCILSQTSIKELVDRTEPYRRYVGKAVYYVGLSPSLPGEPPKKITGRLQREIVYEMDRENLIGRVGTNLDYGIIQELGSTKMAARPHIRPGVLRKQGEFKDILSK